MPGRSEFSDLIDELRAKKNAAILAHNYQRREVQEIADYVGDSLGLILEGLKSHAEVMVLCGIRPMAEIAKALSPEKIVLLPRREAGCPMMGTVAPDDVRRLRAEKPQAAFVCFVNTAAAVKVECDVCCTSSNAVDVVNGLDAEEIVFLPDRNIARWIGRHTSKKIIEWSGFCFVHERIDEESMSRVRGIHPRAPIVVHPGCRPEVIDLADEVLSSGAMVDFAKASNADTIVLGSEAGLIHRLYREDPRKRYYTAGPARMCKNMKMTTLEDVYLALSEEKYRTELPQEVARKVRGTLERMFEICGEVR